MGRQRGWHHEPWIYKACPNEAVNSFLFLHKRSVWNCLSYLVLSVITLTQRKQIWRASNNKLLECAFIPARGCPQGTVLPTLPPCVLQGVAVSGKRISQGPPGNIVALGCPPPLRRVLEWLIQTLPIGLPFQDVVLTAQLHINPETSLERLVPLAEFLTAWKLLPNISRWVLQNIEKGYQIQFGSRPPRFMGVLSTEVAPSRFW